MTNVEKLKKYNAISSVREYLGADALSSDTSQDAKINKTPWDTVWKYYVQNEVGCDISFVSKLLKMSRL
jgi:hypothetical protein